MRKSTPVGTEAPRRAAKLIVSKLPKEQQRLRELSPKQLEGLRAILAPLPKRDQRDLHRLVCELLDLRDVPFLPLPQTNPWELLLNLRSLPRDEWQKLLANEMLLYLAKAYRNGHAQAVPDAREWCRKYRLPVPDWLRDAPDKVSRWGKRSAQTALTTFYIDLTRFFAVLQAERELDGLGDKFDRARELIKDGHAAVPDPRKNNSTKAIKKSYQKFMKHFDSSYYFPPTLLLNWLAMGPMPTGQQPVAPLLWSLLYT